MSAPARDLPDALWIARHLGRRDIALLSGADIEALGTSLESVPLRPGTPLFLEGQEACEVFIVRSGEVDLTARDGPQVLLLSVAGAGEAIGDAAVLCGGPHTFSAVPRSAGTALRLGRGELLCLLREHPAIAVRWATSLAARLEEALARLADACRRDIDARVRSYLGRRLGEAGSGTDIALGQARLAELLGTTRQSVNKALRSLEREGVLRLGYRRIHVLRPEALADG